MMDPNAFLKHTLVAVAISLLPLTPAAYAHGGGKGSGGAGSGGGSASSGSGHGGNGVSAGHSATASKGSHSAADPSTPATTGQNAHQGRIVHAFVQRGTSTGYNSQNTGTTNDDWRRKHQHMLFGVIPVY